MAKAGVCLPAHRPAKRRFIVWLAVAEGEMVSRRSQQIGRVVGHAAGIIVVYPVGISSSRAALSYSLQSIYGHMLFHRSLSPQDKARGARYVLEAAQAGDVKSQYQLAQIHEHGCVQYPRREDYAVTWYARAAQAGHYLAAERLARAYRLGELGLAVDTEQADYWQRVAERQPAVEMAVA